MIEFNYFKKSYVAGKNFDYYTYIYIHTPFLLAKFYYIVHPLLYVVVLLIRRKYFTKIRLHIPMERVRPISHLWKI